MSSAYTNKDLRECASRELRYRNRVYPRLVAEGRMTAERAREETSQMVAIMQHFAALARADERRAT